MSPLLRDELRGGWLGIPQAYRTIDFLGASLGAYFLWAGATGKAPRWSLAALGSVMIFIHVQRFFYAPQTAEGLKRLAQDLNISAEELTRIAQQL